MDRDDRVFLMGEDVGRFGGVFGVTTGLQKRFGKSRVLDTPVSELFIVGAGVGAAITGMRPVVELQFADFIYKSADEIVNKMAKWKYMHGGFLNVPMVVRMPEGAIGGAGPEHSQCPESILLQAPGTYIAIPSNPYDAKGMLKSAIRSDNPVCFFEHKALYRMKGAVPEEEYTVPLDRAAIPRAGNDVTVIAWGRMVSVALEVASTLEERDISIEVVDPRGLRPLDLDTILSSVEKTGRVVITHEAAVSGGAGAEIAALIAENALMSLDAPIRRICGKDVPIPQSLHLERAWLPSAGDLENAIVELID